MRASEFIELIERYSKDEIKVQVHPLIYQHLGLNKVTTRKEMDFMPSGYMGMLSTKAQIFQSQSELLYEATAIIGSDNVVKIPLPFWRELISPQELTLIGFALDLVAKGAKRYYKTKHFGMPHTSIVIEGHNISFRNVLFAAAVGNMECETPVMRKDLSASRAILEKSVKKVLLAKSKETHKYGAVWTQDDLTYARYTHLTYEGPVDTLYPLVEIYIATVLDLNFHYSTYTEATKFEMSSEIEGLVIQLYAKMRSVHYDRLRKEDEQIKG